MSTPRSALEWAIPVGSAVAVVALAVAFWGELPNPLAVRWNADGLPQTAGDRTRELLIGSIVVPATALLPLLLADRPREVGAQRTLVVTGHVLGTLGLGHRWRIVAANREVTHWQDAVSALPPTAVVAVGVLAGATGWWLSGHRRSHGDDQSGPPGRPDPG